MNFKGIQVGIDVGTSQVKVVVCKETENKDRTTSLTVIGLGKSESKGVRHGYISDPNEALECIKRAIKQAEASSGVKIKQCFLSVGGIGLEDIITDYSYIIPRPNPEVTEQDLEQLSIRAENAIPTQLLTNRRIIHAIPLSYRLDGREVLGRPIGLKGIKIEAKMLFVTCMNRHLMDLVGTVENCGVEVIDAMAEPLSASLAILNKAQKKAGCILANIGAETVSLAIFENNLPISLKIFPIGSIDITHDIALRLQISIDEAEKAKVSGAGKQSKKKIDTIIQKKVSDIWSMVDGHLRRIGKSGNLPAGVLIAGGGSKITNIEDMARGALRLPAKVANVEHFSIDNKRHIPDSSWAAAYGLCLWGLDQPDNSRISFDDNTKQIFKNVINWFKQFLP